MPDQTSRLQQLLRGYLANELNATEFSEFWHLLDHEENKALFQQELSQLWKQGPADQSVLPDEHWDRLLLELKSKLDTDEKSPLPARIRLIRRTRWVAAAVLLIGLFSATYYYTIIAEKQELAQGKIPAPQQADRMPGSDKAILTLADGKEILLDHSGAGLLAKQNEASIIKKGDGQIYYDAEVARSAAPVFNKLSTPRGGQYHLLLADGTRVWLNASSSLTYPVVFAGEQRRVEITGEAYFEVARDISRPFIVQTGKTEIEVLGTHFNVNNYDDEDQQRTTLLEGRVKVHTDGGRQQFLLPGQQVLVDPSGKLNLKNQVDLDEVVAWKEGKFQFENAGIYEIMRQLVRWYDIDVQYQNKIDKRFGGIISRNVPLSKVLEMLQKTGEVKLTMNGKKILVQQL